MQLPGTRNLSVLKCKFFSNFRKPGSKAFTLVELMISITIITIISASIIPAFSRYIRNQNLKQAQEQLKSDLRNIQNKALTGSLSDQFINGNSKMKYWGVKFTQGFQSYEFFISALDTDCTVPMLSQGTNSFSDGIKSLSNSGCMFFSISNGGISSLESPIIIGYSNDESKEILFNSTGLIYVDNRGLIPIIE